MKITKFKCSECGKDARIVEVREDATIQSPLHGVDLTEEEPTIDVNEIVIPCGDQLYFKCEECDVVLRNHEKYVIDSYFSLCKYLKKLEEEPAEPPIEDVEEIFPFLEDAIDGLRRIRDNQTVIPSPEDNTERYVYNDLDDAIDAIGKVHDTFKEDLVDRINGLCHENADPDLEEALYQANNEIIGRLECKVPEDWRTP